MLARRIAAATTAAALAAPAAANAAPVVRHTSEGPAATPLIVELIAAAVIGVLLPQPPRDRPQGPRRAGRACPPAASSRRPARTAPSEGH